MWTQQTTSFELQSPIQASYALPASKAKEHIHSPQLTPSLSHLKTQPHPLYIVRILPLRSMEKI